MEGLVNLFADITKPKPRDEILSAAHQQGPHTTDARDSKDSRDARDSRRSRDASKRIRDPSRSTRPDASRNTRNATREVRESKNFGEARESRDTRDLKDTRNTQHSRGTSYLEDLESSPPPYQEIADAVVQPPTESDNNAAPPPAHSSGISPTERCVNEFISAPVDWVIHPSAPHFVICGRCYVDRIYSTQQWRREFVKYTPSTGVLLRCHFGAIPHIEKRWSKVHTAEEFLSFLKVMQRKKVAKHCPGDIYPRANVTWFTTSSIPGIRICQECRRRLFGGTIFSKHFSPTNTSTSSVCHGSLNYTNRMVDELLEEDNWEQFAEGMQIRIQASSCPDQRRATDSENAGWWYQYTESGVTKDSYICEACFLDYAYKTDKESSFSISSKLTTKPLCMASLKDNQMPDTADIEYSRAEIKYLLHGTDRRCYVQGTVGLKWYTTLNNPHGYGVCNGCYLSKIIPIGGEEYYVSKQNIGRRASFACWMNSYHPFFRRHQQLLHEVLITGDLSQLENIVRKFSKMPGCQQGGMGQGKNKRWWGWRSLRICAACMKGGNLVETPTAKKFELHGEKDPYYRICGLYSTQLRDSFFHEDISTLLELAKKRQEVIA